MMQKNTVDRSPLLKGPLYHGLPLLVVGPWSVLWASIWYMVSYVLGCRVWGAVGGPSEVGEMGVHHVKDTITKTILNADLGSCGDDLMAPTGVLT